MTEQGEVLSTRYHDPDLAHRILEQMAYGVLLGAHAAQTETSVPDEWREAMETMSAAGHAAYRALVHDDPEFLVFWRQATPIDEISQLKLGSRPELPARHAERRRSARHSVGFFVDAKPVCFPRLVRTRLGARCRAEARGERPEAPAHDVCEAGRFSRPRSTTRS